MTKRHSVGTAALAATLILGLVIIPAGPVGALDKIQSACASSKLKATGKKAFTKIKCEAKAIQQATNVDSECLGKAESKFGDAFGKAEAGGGCISEGDAAAVEVEVDGLVERVVTLQTIGNPLPSCSGPGTPCGTCADGMCLLYGTSPGCISTGSINDGLDCTSDTQCTTGEYCVSLDGTATACGAPCGATVGPGPLDKAESACASSKLKATGKKVKAKLLCHAKAARASTNVDSDCLTKAETKFSDAFAKAELKGGCISEGDEATVEGIVDRFVDSMVTRQTTVIIIVPLPSCSALGAVCGSCGDGMCVESPTGLGCISTTILDGLGCTSDAQCAAGKYCLHLFDFPTFPWIPPFPEWACATPCP